MNIKFNTIIKLIIIILISSPAFAQTRVLDVPAHTSPSGSNWCWAGCTTMATQYYGNSTSECEIVEWARLNISIPNRGNDNCCSYPDSCYGGIYISNFSSILYSENLHSNITYNVVPLNTVQSMINDNRPLIIHAHHNPNGGWHLMIIIGYDGNYLHYNDPSGGSYITQYNDAISTDCMGRYLWRWENRTYTLTDQPCPIDLNLTEDIDADADIIAQSDIVISCTIGNNRNITLTAGEEITFSSGFEIPVGSTLIASVESNPCQ